MNNILKLFWLFFLIASAVFAQPKPPVLSKDQISNLKKEGADLFKSENYKEALKRYQQLYNAEPNNVDYNYKLGISYLKSNVDKKRAAEYLKNVVGKKDAAKDILYEEAIALTYNDEFNEAIEAFEKYKEANHGKTNPKYMVDQRIEWCHNALELMKTPIDVRFTNLGKNVNSVDSDFGPVVGANDDIIYFSSNRKGNLGGIMDGFGEYLTDIYYTTGGDTSYNRAKTIGTNINTEAYDIVLNVSPNGDKMLVYREGGDANGDIYYTELKGKQWNKTIIFGQQFETKEKEMGASISVDGKTIYFAAEMKGTKGGIDIYKCEKDTSTGKWSTPINLGDNINTKFDEINPVIFADSKTLFFASQGHTSMGGFDMFKSVMPDPRQGWGKAVNIGYPLNTVFDDKDLQLNGTGKVGYISALRPGGFGETDIYKVTFKESLISPPSVFVKIKVLTQAGTPTKEAVCTIIKKSTGENLGTVMVNSSSGLANYSLPAGSYSVKIRSPKVGKVDEDIIIKGDEPGFEKDFTYTLK